jgi:HEAT repeat protein
VWPSELPLEGLFGPVGVAVLTLFAANALVFVSLIVLRENWALRRRQRERVRPQMEEVVARLLADDDPERATEEFRTAIRSLGRHGRPVLAWLVLDLAQDADDRTLARVREGVDGSGVIAVAESGTRGRIPWRRRVAIEFLGAFGGEHSVPVLAGLLEDRRLDVRIAAARALGAIGAPQGAPALTKAFLERRNVPPGIAHDALRRLGPAGADAFRRGLAAPASTLRLTSCFGLAATADGREAAARLAEVLDHDPAASVRAAAAKALAQIAGAPPAHVEAGAPPAHVTAAAPPAHVEAGAPPAHVTAAAPPAALARAARDDEPQVRREAVAALGRYDDPGQVELLAELMGDDDRETALRAAEVLLALTRTPRAAAPARRAFDGSSGWATEHVRTVAELAT